MGIFGWIKGIFKRKERTTPTVTTTQTAQQYTETKAIEKDKTDNLHFPAPKKETPPEPPKTVEKKEEPKKITPKYSKLALRIKAQQTRNGTLTKKLDSTEKISTINNIHIGRQEYINSQSINNNYEKLLSGKVIGKDKQLMDDIIENREAILRHRISAEVIIRDREGHAKITFQLQGVLIEELSLIKDYIYEGLYINLKYGRDSFREHIWPSLRDVLLQNNVRGVGEPKLFAGISEEGFIVGNVEMNINYA